MGQVLLLNADAQPVSYLPLSAIEWKEAITYLWLDKVHSAWIGMTIGWCAVSTWETKSAGCNHVEGNASAAG